MAVLAAQWVGGVSVKGIVYGLGGLACCIGVAQGLQGLRFMIALTDTGGGTIVG